MTALFLTNHLNNRDMMNQSYIEEKTYANDDHPNIDDDGDGKDHIHNDHIFLRPNDQQLET